MEKLKICLFTTIYKRYELTNYVLNYYNKLRQHFSEKVELILVCAGSEGELSKKQATKHGFNYVECENSPVSKKHNIACMECKQFNPDAVIYVGSDDVISYGLFGKYIDLINLNYDFVGVKDVYFLKKDSLLYWSGYKVGHNRYMEPIGPGKMFSKNLIEKLNWKPWGDSNVNKGLDSYVTKNLKKHIYTSKTLCLKEEEEYLIDIKTSFNISNLKDFKFEEKKSYEFTKEIGFDFDKIKEVLFV